MRALYPEKLVTIITTDVLEPWLAKIVRRRGASGYTVVRARGAGSSGEQSSMLDGDTNIKFQVVLPERRLEGLLEDLECMMKKGHHLTVLVSDVSVLHPEKYDRPLD